jgi:hypothetical protein
LLLLLFTVTIFSPQVVRSAPEVPDDAEVLDIQDALKLVEIMENRWQEVDGYTVITYKQERHGGELMDRERIFTKFKRPFSVYMKWIEDNPPKHKNPNLGQEMIYEKGWNNNMIYAHLGKRSYFPSWVTSASSWIIDYTALDPNGRVATMYQRHTIDEVPYGATIERIARAVRSGIKHPDDGVYFVDHGYKNVMGKEPSSCIEGYMPAGKRDAYYEHRVLVCVDLDTKMPSQFIVRNEQGQILENYRMTDITVNPGLKQAEFRPDYPEYNFK